MTKRPPRANLEDELIWSEPIDLRVFSGQKRVTLTPDPVTQKKIIKSFDLLDLQDFVANIELNRAKGAHTVHVKGTIKANITQACVVSLEPVHTEINENFEAFYADYNEAVPFSHARKELYTKHGMTDIPVLEEDEDPEPIDKEGVLNLGDMVLQFFSLAVDLYPRSENYSLPDNVISDEDDVNEKQSNIAKNPFEALRHWKSDGQGKKD